MIFDEILPVVMVTERPNLANVAKGYQFLESEEPMARYEEVLSVKAPKREKKQLREIVLRKADNGGVVAEHRMSSFDGKDPVHAFGADEGHKLAAHLTKHLGMKIPGNHADGAGEEEEGNEEYEGGEEG